MSAVSYGFATTANGEFAGGKKRKQVEVEDDGK
jgi:hypothetical protein